MKLDVSRIAVTLAAAILVCLPSAAQAADENAEAQQKGEAATAAPPYSDFPDLSDIADPAFDQHVNLILLGQAWADLDAAMLTDIGLQLAEGERILHRQHKGVSADQVLQLAAKVAADNRDQKTLDRLSTVAEANKNEDLSSLLASSRKLASQSRKSDPALSLHVDDTKPQQLSVYKDAINELRAAGILGNTDQLEMIANDLEGKKGPLEMLTEQQREYLKKVMGESRSAAQGADTANQISGTLNKLKAASRHGDHGGGGGGGGGWSGGGLHGGGGWGGGWGGNTWHNTSHWDYHPGGFVPHGDHWHYQPGHYDWHETGHHH